MQPKLICNSKIVSFLRYGLDKKSACNLIYIVDHNGLITKARYRGSRFDWPLVYCPSLFFESSSRRSCCSLFLKWPS